MYLSIHLFGCVFSKFVLLLACFSLDLELEATAGNVSSTGRQGEQLQQLEARNDRNDRNGDGRVSRNAGNGHFFRTYEYLQCISMHFNAFQCIKQIKINQNKSHSL